MKRLWKVVKYSGIWTVCAGAFSSIVGFALDQNTLTTILFLILLLFGGCAALITVEGTGNGTVTGPNINCTISNSIADGVCEAIVRANDPLDLLATPASGFDFKSWNNCDQPNGDVCTMFMDNGNETVIANFVQSAPDPPQTFTLTVIVDDKGPDGRVSSNVGGIDCPGTCSAVFNAGTVVSLEAHEDGDSVFDGWSNCQSTFNEIISVTMNSDLTCQANFIEGE